MQGHSPALFRAPDSDLGAQPAVGPAGPGGAAGDPGGEEREGQGRDIRKHVSGVGEQGERARPPGPEQFHTEISAGQAERDHQRSSRGVAHAGTVKVVVVVRPRHGTFRRRVAVLHARVVPPKRLARAKTRYRCGMLAP